MTEWGRILRDEFRSDAKTAHGRIDNPHAIIRVEVERAARKYVLKAGAWLAAFMTALLACLYWRVTHARHCVDAITDVQIRCPRAGAMALPGH